MFKTKFQLTLDLKRWTAALSGFSLPKISIPHMLKNREMGGRRVLASHRVSSMSNTSDAFTLSEKANLVNRFLPNKWTDIDRLHLGLFRCVHLPEEKLVCISQGKCHFEILSVKNLYVYFRQSSRYQFLYKIRIPNNGFITDFARNTKGDQLAYATCSVYGIVFFILYHYCY
uniref:Tub domain-containing protein n=1 Tax=Elaeophora elaphi TaxID=1147741 RepID=A0A0R3RP32_9BILA